MLQITINAEKQEALKAEYVLEMVFENVARITRTASGDQYTITVEADLPVNALWGAILRATEENVQAG